MIFTTNSIVYRCLKIAARHYRILTAAEIANILSISISAARGSINVIRSNRKVYSSSTRNGGYALSPAALPKNVARFIPVPPTVRRASQPTALGRNEIKVFICLNTATGVMTAGEIAKLTKLTISQVRKAIKNLRSYMRVLSFPTSCGGYTLPNKPQPKIWQFAA